MRTHGRLVAAALGLLLLFGKCAAADWSIGALRLHALDGFEKQADNGRVVQFKNSAGVAILVSVLGVPAESEAKRFGGDSERHLKFHEQTAQKVYESSLQGGERISPISREDLPNGNTLLSGAIRIKGLLGTKYFLIYMFVAPVQRIGIVTVEGTGDALQEYKHYRALFDGATWQDPAATPEATAFTERVANILRSKLPDATVSVKGPLTLSIGDIQANLDRIFSFCTRDAAQCDGEIDRYVLGVKEALHTASEPVSRESVRLIVRASNYLDIAQRSLGGADLGFQPKSLPGGFVILLAIDSPKTIRMISTKNIKDLGLSGDEPFELGAANLRKALKPMAEAAKPVEKAHIGIIDSDPYNSSRLALIDAWSPLAQSQGGSLIVAAPANDTLLYIGEDNAIAIDALRTMVRDVMQHASAPLSATLLRWTPGGWEVVP